MKRIKILLATALLSMGLTATAQPGDKENYHKVNVEYSLMNVKMDGGDTKQNWNGFCVGYSYNIKMGDMPLHLELGAKLDYHFYNGNTIIDATRTAKYNVFSATLPIMNLGVDINLGKNVMLVPYAGIAYKIYIGGKEKGDTDNRDIFDKDVMTTDELWSRTVGTWQIGVDAFYKRYFIGAYYGGDLEKTCPQANTYKTLNFRIGYCF